MRVVEVTDIGPFVLACHFYLYAYSIRLYAINIHMNLLTQILSSQVRAEVFRILFGGDLPSIHLRDIQRRSGLSIGTIQKEMSHLKKMDLIVAERDGNRLYYKANSDHPLYLDICGLVKKTSGIATKLQAALQTLDGIECAIIFGSYAKGDEKSHSDIDLIVIGNLGLRTLVGKLKPLSDEVEREINPHIYSTKSWKEKLKKNDHFVKSVMNEKKIFLIGDEDVLG